jgi:Ca2+-binding RTX toxin-like protein
MTTNKEYTVTYKVSSTGTDYIYQENKNGHLIGDHHKSSGGHMWYSLSDGISTPSSYGFSSEREEMHGPGYLTPHDNAAYQQTTYEVTIKLTEEQFTKLKKFSENPQSFGFHKETYKLLTNSCVDFVYASLQQIGYNKDNFQGNLLPNSNVDNINKLLATFGANIIRDNIKRLGDYYEGEDAASCKWLGPEHIMQAVIDNEASKWQFIPSNQLTFDRAVSTDYLANKFNKNGQLDKNFYNDFSKWFSDTLRNSFNQFQSQFVPSFQLGNSGLNHNPIGAFYDSRSLATDTASSIADKTLTLFDQNQRGLTTNQLTALDTNADGQLSGNELNSVSAWADLNENGQVDADEMKTLAQRGIGAVSANDFGFFTQGNSRFGATAVAPVRVDATRGVPGSDFRRLRDTDNMFFNRDWSAFIGWDANRVKINFENQNHMVGTDGDDSFNANYYAAYTQYFNTSLLTHFLAGGGNDNVGGSARSDSIWGGTGNDALWGYAGNDSLYGEEGDDQLSGDDGADYLDGGVGNDSLYGGMGADVLVGGEGGDYLFGEADNDYLYGQAGVDQLVGGAGDDYLDGGSENDLLFGDAGADTLFGGAGLDQLQGGAGNDRLLGEAGNDRLFGQVGNDQLWGGDGDDVLVGFTASNDSKQSLTAGETDDDLIYGGNGDDYVLGGLGNDTLYGDAGNDDLEGGAGEDLLYGGSGADRLFGQLGDDVLYGGDGDDILIGFTASNDSKQTLSAGETDNDWLYGGAGSDTLLGGLGNDYLDGGAGADNMQGGLGDDTYVVNSVNDVILERKGEGYDRVISSTSYLLNAHIEELRLVEGLDIHGTGNAQDNLLIGNSRDNILDGVTGADRMLGGAGNDTYYVDNRGDRTVELAGEGLDTVQASISHTLAANVENLILLDFSKAERGSVDGQASLVYGYPKANELDYMQGDAEPTFLGTCALTAIANLLTQADRPTSEGEVLKVAIDNKWTVQDPTLSPHRRGGSNFLQQQAILASYGVRNDLISGYNETGTANLLRSGRGVMQAVNAGTLWDNPAYNDNGAVNHMVTLTGVVYSETSGELLGFYIADSGRQKVSDMTRFVSIERFRQAANVAGGYTIYTLEPLKLWDEDINATGNNLDNLLVGNRGNNLLSGGAGNDVLEGQGGNDTLDGGAGNDTLVGGAGNDTYVFGRGYGHDTIVQTGRMPADVEYVRFLETVGPDNLWFSRSANDLDVRILGSNDRLTVRDWFSDSSKQVTAFQTSAGEALIASKVNQLIDAMAAFAPPSSSSSSLPANYQAALQPVLAASWG